jgi:hypothetical protein
MENSPYVRFCDICAVRTFGRERRPSCYHKGDTRKHRYERRHRRQADLVSALLVSRAAEALRVACTT